MAAFNLPSKATYEVHETCKIDTQGKCARLVFFLLQVLQEKILYDGWGEMHAYLSPGS